MANSPAGHAKPAGVRASLEFHQMEVFNNSASSPTGDRAIALNGDLAPAPLSGAHGSLRHQKIIRLTYSHMGMYFFIHG
jgi:hypothetical protein